MNSLPEPGDKRIAIYPHPAAEKAIRQGHPWLFDQSIQKQSHQGQSGDLAVVFDRKRRFLAVGLYDPDSPIRVRILAHGQAAQIDAAWLQQSVAQAAALRQPLLADLSNGYRLVHGENDGLPGLVIDRYQDTYVVKIYSTAWVPWLPDVTAALVSLMNPERIVLRLNRASAHHEPKLHGLKNGSLLFGSPLAGPVRFQENGLHFEADVVKGQKTGFFLDQRENRARVEQLAQGCRVLNVFAYTGGFSLYAARGGAAEVISLDMSQPALDSALRSFDLNKQDPIIAAASHEILQGDAFDLLKRMAVERRRFDMVIIDPPSFAKRKEEVDRAMGAYRQLVRLGLNLMRRGGTLVIASCSSRVEADDFFDAVHEAARSAGRSLHEIERTAHALDHPIRFKEGSYLKCLFARAP